MDEESIFRRLIDDVVNFDADDIREAASLALKLGIPPEKVVNEALAKGMEIVGDRYEKDEFFLPDLIMAGETMNEATKVLFDGQKTDPNAKANVVLATVKGDIHDIGKNILSNLLNGAGVWTHDLGVDVSNDEIAGAVESLRPKVLGLSSMITTTRDEIKTVIKELHSRGLRQDLKIIIGGESTGRDFAKMAGVDAYSKEATEGVRIIRGWINSS